MSDLQERGLNPFIECYDLKKEFDSPAGRLEILKGVRFSLRPGEMSFIVGRSGSGKSTLLNLLGGLDQPSSGKIMFEGENMTAMRERKLSKLRCLRIGFVFQSFHLLPELTLYENILLPTVIAGKSNPKWVKELLRRVKLTSRQDHYPAELSGGEQQRGAIARALANKPSVVLCDEPTGNLDSESAEAVLSLITDLNQSDGQAVVVITHDEAMAWRYENVFRLVDGLLLPEGERGINLESMS